MKKLFALLALTAIGCFAQDVTSLEDFKNFLLHPPVQVLSITASQGDGTTCVANKSLGPVIYMSLVCLQTNGTLKTAVLKVSGTVPSSAIFGLGNVTCLFLLNPTAAAIPALGSWTAIPANGVGWQCTTDIVMAGVATGQTPVVAGAVSWP